MPPTNVANGTTLSKSKCTPFQEGQQICGRHPSSFKFHISIFASTALVYVQPRNSSKTFKAYTSLGAKYMSCQFALSVGQILTRVFWTRAERRARALPPTNSTTTTCQWSTTDDQQEESTQEHCNQKSGRKSRVSVLQHTSSPMYWCCRAKEQLLRCISLVHSRIALCCCFVAKGYRKLENCSWIG